LVLSDRIQLAKLTETAPTAKVAAFAEDGFHPHTPTMQTANKSDQNSTLAASQETGINNRIRVITYHRDGTVTLWDMSRQEWVRTNHPSDQLLGSLHPVDSDRIRWYLKNGVRALATI
jgi:hypothetical protein